MLLHEESYKPADKKRRKRGMARHYYDLFQLIKSGVAEQAGKDLELFERIANHRKVYFKYGWMDYNTLTPGQLRLIPREDQMADWKSDYAVMQQEMFYGEVPSFEQVITVVQGFQDAFNKS
jgi:hypothetical protein